MRIVIDSLIGLMLVAVVAVAVVLHLGAREEEQAVEQVRSAIEQLKEQTAYQSTLQSAVQGRDMLIVHIDEDWFGKTKPINALLGEDNPWIDLAPPGDLGVHPPDPVVTGPGQAGFWYNPTVGVFRARVLPQASEAKTLELYNKVNSTVLPEFDPLPDQTRTPIAHVPGKAPALLYASMANRTWTRHVVEPVNQASEQQAIQTPASSTQQEPKPIPHQAADEPVIPAQADLGDQTGDRQGHVEDASAPSKPAIETTKARPTLD